MSAFVAWMHLLGVGVLGGLVTMAVLVTAQSMGYYEWPWFWQLAATTLWVLLSSAGGVVVTQALRKEQPR